MTCIGSGVHGIRSIINEGKTGYLTGTSTSEIRNTVKGVIQNSREPTGLQSSPRLCQIPNSYSQYIKAEATG